MKAPLSVLVVLAAAYMGATPADALADDLDGPGDTAWALPGIMRTGRVPRAPGPARVTIAATAGYGTIEAQEGELGGHHRAAGSASVGIVPLPWLGAALRLDGRVDLHPDDAYGADRTFVAAPSVALRVGGAPFRLFGGGVAEALGGLDLGASFVLIAPGSAAPSLLVDALSYELTGLASYFIASAELTFATEIGYRRDRSAAVVDHPLTIRQGDRIALGSSDFDALLIRLGVARPVGPVELLGETSWDVLLGDRAPSATTSPLRFAAGGRVRVADGLAISLTAELLASGRPSIDSYQPFIPIEPRFTVMAGLRTRVPLGEVVARPAVTAEDEEASDTATDDGAPRRSSGTRTFRGRIVDEDGHAVAGAQVRAERGAEVVRTTTGADGHYVLERVPEPPVQVIIEADGFRERRIEVPDDGGPPPDLILQPEGTRGWLRGVVQSFDGQPVHATIRLSPSDIELETGDDGTFEVRVPAGSYEVSIHADGWYDQRRQVEVEDNGVTVVNADLRRSSRRSPQ